MSIPVGRWGLALGDDVNGDFYLWVFDSPIIRMTEFSFRDAHWGTKPEVVRLQAAGSSSYLQITIPIWLAALSFAAAIAGREWMWHRGQKQKSNASD